MLDANPPILSLSAAELEVWLEANDAPAYRRRQLWGWLARGAASFQAMHDVPKPLRAALERDFRITSLRSVAVSQAGPITASSTLQAPTARLISSAKSTPGPIASTSMKTWPSPKRLARRSYNRPAKSLVSCRR